MRTEDMSVKALLSSSGGSQDKGLHVREHYK
jgi:hypothetical protein